MKHIFILGSKGIPARYGGFETFVEQLTARSQDSGIKYHVSCMASQDGEFEHNGARCFNISVPKIGAARAVLYDLLSLNRAIGYIRKNGLKDCAIYILACRIGPFLSYFKRRLERLGISLYINPDGQEWKRSKWNAWIKKYWKWSERLMIKHADRIICDSLAIEANIRSEYAKYRPDTTYISYGADLIPSKLANESETVQDWYIKHSVRPEGYYLMVGRFVPENNYELVIQEFMQSDTNRDLVIVSNVSQNAFYEGIRSRTGFDKDPRIKFVGTIYDQELLKRIRESAFGYIHGHEVGGTNPSLLEALASTSLNLLLNVVFNEEVGGSGAVYFAKKSGSLSRLIGHIDSAEPDYIRLMRERAQARITERYDWTDIVTQYERLFHSTVQEKNPREVTPFERNLIGRRKRDEAVSADDIGVEAVASDL